MTTTDTTPPGPEKPPPPRSAVSAVTPASSSVFTRVKAAFVTATPRTMFLAATGTVVVVVGACFGGVGIANATVFSGAKTDYATAQTQLVAAEKANTVAGAKYAALNKTGTDFARTAAATNTALVGLVDPAAGTAFSTYLATLAVTLKAGPGGAIVSVSPVPEGTTEEYRAATELLGAAITAEDSNTRAVSKYVTVLTVALAAADVPVQGLSSSIAGISPTVLTANGTADPSALATYTTLGTAAGPAVLGKLATVAVRLDSLTKYAVAGKALTDSTAAVAAAAAQAAAAATAAQAAADAVVTVKIVNGKKVTVKGSGSSGNTGGSTGSSGSTGGSSSGGGTTAPATGDPNGPYSSCIGWVSSGCDHTPHVTANGQYTPGCDGFYSYMQSTGSGGGIIINVNYPYTYTTFSTSDGWGLKVFGC